MPPEPSVTPDPEPTPGPQPEPVATPDPEPKPEPKPELPADVLAKLARIEALEEKAKQADELAKWKADKEKEGLGEKERAAAELKEAQDKVASLETKDVKATVKVGMAYATVELGKLGQAKEGLSFNLTTVMPAECFEASDEMDGLTDKAKAAIVKFHKDNPALFESGEPDKVEGIPAGGANHKNTTADKGYWGDVWNKYGWKKG